MAKVDIYEYKFVAADFVGEPDKPWDHIGVLLAASHPHITWTEENMRPIVDEIASAMATAADLYDAFAAVCRPDHLTRLHPTGKDNPTCRERSRRLDITEPWCERRARLARECCRTPARPMLVRIHVSSIDVPTPTVSEG